MSGKPFSKPILAYVSDFRVIYALLQNEWLGAIWKLRLTIGQIWFISIGYTISIGVINANYLKLNALYSNGNYYFTMWEITF